MKKKYSKNKGITLIALIITIIVLLILAVVAIRVVTGEGIIAHAKNARDNYNKAQIVENGVLQNYANYITGSIEGSNPSNPNEGDSNVDHITSDGVPIPKGFSQVEGTTKATGLVITDNNSNGASEFVWIPVENINNMVMCQTHGASVTLDTNTLKCPTCEENTKLAGKLYATSTGENFNEELTGQTYTAGSRLREPDNLSSDSDIAGWTNTLYQDTFTLMAKSVAKYKGFYVGRYEMSLNGSGNAQSKLGEGPASAAGDSANQWYGLYQKARTYTNEANSVQSEMIWGCQYDAMMKFILTTPDASHVTAKTNVSHDLSDIYQTGGTNYIGSITYNDKAANIYDLEGNVYEWTQEVYDTNCRVYRGGGYEVSDSPGVRYYNYPWSPYSGVGCRLALYIK